MCIRDSYISLNLNVDAELTENHIKFISSNSFLLDKKSIKSFDMAIGFEYRDLNLKKIADDFSDGAGQQYPHNNLNGDLDVYELFTEFYFPIITDTSLNFSLRFSDYSLEETAFTYDFGIIQKNEKLSYSALRGKVLDSPFFLSVYENFEGQFKKYRTKKGFKDILNKLRFRYLKDALYNNSLSFKDGIRVEKVTTKIKIGTPGKYRGSSLSQQTLSLVYFLFQRKGKKGLNQKVAMWQYPWKKEVLERLSQLKNQKGDYWEKYKAHLEKSLKKKWLLSELGKKSNYFMGCPSLYVLAISSGAII